MTRRFGLPDGVRFSSSSSSRTTNAPFSLGCSGSLRPGSVPSSSSSSSGTSSSSPDSSSMPSSSPSRPPSSTSSRSSSRFSRPSSSTWTSSRSSEESSLASSLVFAISSVSSLTAFADLDAARLRVGFAGAAAFAEDLRAVDLDAAELDEVFLPAADFLPAAVFLSAVEAVRAAVPFFSDFVLASVSSGTVVAIVSFVAKLILLHHHAKRAYTTSGALLARANRQLCELTIFQGRLFPRLVAAWNRWSPASRHAAS